MSVYALPTLAIDTTPVSTSPTSEISATPESKFQECATAESWTDSQNQHCQTFELWQQPLLRSDVDFAEPLEVSDPFLSPPLISYAAADLGGEVAVDWTTAQQPSAPPATTQPAPQPPSDALNLPVLRSLKKPVARKVLDTGVLINGIEPKDTSGNFWKQDFFTGNWGGSRDHLLKQGIDFYLANFSDIYSNVGGGKSQNTAYSNVVLAGLDLYTSKLGWWKDGQIHVTAVNISGVSVARDYVGALNTVYFVDPPERSTRLFEIWYGQKFGSQSEYEVRIGKIFPFVRIAASQTFGIFTNTSFQYPTYLGVASNTGMVIPFASAPLGIQMSYTPGSQWLFLGQLQDGFDDPTGGFNNHDGLNTGINAREGIEGLFEIVYRANQERGSTGLPGYYRLGFQFHSGMFQSQSENTKGQSLALFGGAPKEEWGNYGFWFIVDQMIYRESPDPRDRTQGLNIIFKTVFAPRQDINTISFNIAGGLAYEGLFPGRKRDVLAIGASYTRFSDGVRTFDQDSQSINPSGVVRDGETVLELLYLAEITPWWSLIGSVQRIFQPGGTGSIPDATVIGVSSRIAF